MKVLEAQSAVLSNFEVHQHVLQQRERYKKSRHRGPPNYETVVKELSSWLEASPSPMSQKPSPYTLQSIPMLLERLRPYDLSKGEVVMILNLRPANVVALNVIVEDMADRFDEAQQEELVTIITDVLGAFEPAEEALQENGEGDVAMDDAGQAA